ncbi:MAG: hypothetical protein PHI98_14270 [Eubacteriales bacterium]|nr:hypothetical protein [Eubacteriales bacterium]
MMKCFVTNQWVHRLYDEAGAVLASVRRKNGQYVGLGADGQERLSIARGQKEELIVAVKGRKTKARMLYAPKEGELLPSRAECVFLPWEGEEITIRQDDKRNFTISSPHIGGMLTGILGWKSMIEVNSDSLDLVMLLYGMALFMLHEDDMELV